MAFTHADLVALLHDWLIDYTDAYDNDDTDNRYIHVDGTLDLHRLATAVLSGVDPCPCDCEDLSGRYSFGRWTSGSFTGEGPLRSAWTCEAHSPLVAAWCHLGTGIAPEFTPAKDNRVIERES